MLEVGSAGVIGGRPAASSPQSSLFPQVNHTVALSTIGESNYHFGVTYVGTKQLSPTEVRFLSFHSLCPPSNKCVASPRRLCQEEARAAEGAVRGDRVSPKLRCNTGHSFILNPCALPDPALHEALNAKPGVGTFSRGHWRAEERFGPGKVMV